MDFSKVGEKILSSVRSARSLGLLSPTSNRPEVPARAVAAATIARAIAGLPPHQRHSFASSSEELSSIYSIRPQVQVIEELEEEFYEEDFDPVRHVLEHVPCEEDDLAYLEEKAALRLAQLDRIGERLSQHVMEHHEEMVKGMHLVRELEKDMKIANVICMNGRRHLTSSMNEISRDLIVSTHSKRKQALLDVLPILTELRHALDMQMKLEVHVEEGNFFKAFQVLSEYLQVLDSLAELSVIQEMSRGVEVWLGKTLQKLDSLLLGVCQDFREEGYVTVVDAYALIGDVSGLAEKIQSYFMQEVLSETHSVLKNIVQEDSDSHAMKNTRLTYSDLCLRIPESMFRQCLLTTLAVLFKLMCSYHAIMSFQPDSSQVSACRAPPLKLEEDAVSGICGDAQHVDSVTRDSCSSPRDDEARDGGNEASSSGSPWFQLRKEATTFVSQTLQRGSRNVLQLTTSRLSVLLSSPAVCSTSIHQFLKNYEDLNTFILAGEAFCGFEAVDFRQKVKAVCENYYLAFHQQNICALKMVMEKENWLTMPPDTTRVVSFTGLVGDGAALISPSDKSSKSRRLLANRSTETGSKKTGFSFWLEGGNPFLPKLGSTFTENHDSLIHNGSVASGEPERKADKNSQNHNSSPQSRDKDHVSATADSDDENEDLHADFIDEDSQLPSRILKPNNSRNHSSHWNDEEMRAHTGSSLCLLRLMDKYARLMQILEIVNVELFKGICQLFGIFFHFLFESFGQQNNHPNGKALNETLTYRLKTALSRIIQDCDQWINSQSISFSSSATSSLNVQFTHMDVTPSPPSTNFGHQPGTSFGLKERCAGAETITLVARLLHRSKAHLQSMLLQNNAAIVEDFYAHLVDSVPDLTEHIHRTTTRSLLHIDGYVDRIATAKWEVKDLGTDHNGYVDLLLGEFKHYKTRLAHGGIQKEVADLLLVYGLENLAEILIEGLSRVKRCTDEGRALMQLDLQVLINGLQHFAPINVKPKLQIVETFIKAYYLPETEYVHWAHGHPEYSKNQIAGLINLVATMKGWKRKTRLEVLEKIEGANM